MSEEKCNNENIVSINLTHAQLKELQESFFGGPKDNLKMAEAGQGGGCGALITCGCSGHIT